MQYYAVILKKNTEQEFRDSWQSYRNQSDGKSYCDFKRVHTLLVNICHSSSSQSKILQMISTVPYLP